jgi:PAS domain S-box-containing protein
MIMKRVKSLIRNSPVVIAMIYISIGFLWIQFSDQWVFAFLDDPESITRVQSLKGWFFVAASGLLIFLLIRKSNNMFGEVIQDLNMANIKFDSTIQNAPVGIAHHRPDEKWIEVNQTLCHMLGYTKKELMQLSFSDFIHTDDLEKGRELDKKLAQGEIKNFEIEKRYIRKDGSTFPGLIRKSAVRDINGSKPYLIAVLEDITRQKENEENVRKSLREKEVLLAEVHHRVKNNLALISALFDLQSMYTENTQIHSILDKSNIRIKCLSMIHESFSYSENSAEINFETCLKQLMEFLSLSLSPDDTEIPISEDLSPVQLNINLAIPVSLIFTELMINASPKKFNTTGNPELSVSLHEKSGKISLTLACTEKEIFENEQSDTLTFMIVNTLVKQIEGELNSITENGTYTYKLTFKKSSVKGGGNSMPEDGHSSVT